MSKFVKLALIILIFSACSKMVKKDDLSILGPEGEKAAYKVEIASTKQELETGLMNRDSLAENSGMLFDLRQFNEPISMWMKDTRISLDMIFIDQDGNIFWIYENAQPMSTTLILPPFQPAAVLEVNAGDAKKFNIKVGDVVKHKWFANKNPIVQPAPTSEAPAEPVVQSEEETTSPAEPAAESPTEAPAPAAEPIAEPSAEQPVSAETSDNK